MTQPVVTFDDLTYVLILAPIYLALVAYMTLKEYKPMTDRLSRAARTFWQAFIPTALTIIGGKLTDVKAVGDLSGFASIVTPLLLGAASSALSVAWYSLFPPVSPPPAE